MTEKTNLTTTWWRGWWCSEVTCRGLQWLQGERAQARKFYEVYKRGYHAPASFRVRDDIARHVNHSKVPPELSLHLQESQILDHILSQLLYPKSRSHQSAGCGRRASTQENQAQNGPNKAPALQQRDCRNFTNPDGLSIHYPSPGMISFHFLSPRRVSCVSVRVRHVLKSQC